jgi:mxaD protein
MGADMARAEAIVDIPVDADTLWRRIGSFQEVADWHPMLETVESSGDRPGAVREAVTVHGQRQVERLREVDESARFYRYTIDSGPLPVRGYVAELRVHSTGANSSRVRWVCDFRLAPGGGADTIETVQAFLTVGLDNLRQEYARSEGTA